MYYALIDTGSLKNPLILNEFTHVKVTVQHEPESPSNPYHYNFLIKSPASQLEKIIKKIQAEMKPSWYAFFWNQKTLIIVFNEKYFEIKIPEGWQSNTYKAAQKFGRSQDIPEVYLNFKKYFQPFATIAKN